MDDDHSDDDECIVVERKEDTPVLFNKKWPIEMNGERHGLPLHPYLDHCMNLDAKFVIRL